MFKRIKLLSYLVAAAYLLCGIVLFLLIPKLQAILTGFSTPLPLVLKTTFFIGSYGWLCLTIEAAIFVIIKDFKYRSRLLNPLFTAVLMLWAVGLIHDVAVFFDLMSIS